VRLRDLLAHLYVLIPVLDDEKHYWVGDDEVEKLISKGEGWLPAHPEKEQIARRYLKHRRDLTRSALDRLTTEEGMEIAEQDDERARGEDAVEEKLSLNEQRLDAVVKALKDADARSVIDLVAVKASFSDSSSRTRHSSASPGSMCHLARWLLRRAASGSTSCRHGNEPG